MLKIRRKYRIGKKNSLLPKPIGTDIGMSWHQQKTTAAKGAL